MGPVRPRLRGAGQLTERLVEFPERPGFLARGFQHLLAGCGIEEAELRPPQPAGRLRDPLENLPFAGAVVARLIHGYPLHGSS